MTPIVCACSGKYEWNNFNVDPADFNAAGGSNCIKWECS